MQRHNAGLDCILEAARSLLANQDLIADDALLRPVLRLTANCCADDNVSRSIMVNRGGIGSMKQLALQSRALDLLLPTLYNVCVDYEEIAVDEQNQPLRMNDLDTSVELTRAEQVLGSCVGLSPMSITAVELFLNLSASSNEMSFGFLTDLAEMASRPALFGVQHIFSEDRSSWPAQSNGLLDSLFTHGVSLIYQDEEIAQTVLQTFLNVLSQKQIQLALLQSCEFLLAIVTLLELEPDRETDAEEELHEMTDLSRYRESLFQLIYTASALPEYAEAYDPAKEQFSRLVRQLEQVHMNPEATIPPYQKASLLVLVANALTAPDRIAQCLSRLPAVPEIVANILRHTIAPINIIPALDLAGRLALDPAGQRSLLSTGILETLNRKLQPHSTTPDASGKSHTFTIHREAVALTRLLLKSPSAGQQNPTTSQLTPNQPLHNTILTLFTTTLDASTKLEISRYAVEVLRNITSTSTPITLPRAPLLPSLLYLTTESQTPASRAEGVFGLGLLLSSSATPDSSTSTATALSALLPTIIEHGPALLSALTQILDVAAAVPEPVNGGGDVAARTRQAEAENAKLVVVRLLLAVGRGEQRDTGNVEHGDLAAAEAGDQQKRAEFVSGLEELAERMGVRA